MDRFTKEKRARKKWINKGKEDKAYVRKNYNVRRPLKLLLGETPEKLKLTDVADTYLTNKLYENKIYCLRDLLEYPIYKLITIKGVSYGYIAFLLRNIENYGKSTL